MLPDGYSQKPSQMNHTAIYDKYVTGKNFIGRKTECNGLANLLGKGEHVAIYEPPKAGKTSLIQQSLFNMKVEGKDFLAGQFSLLNIRTLPDFLRKFASTLLRMTGTTAQEFAAYIEKYLGGTHFTFDEERFGETEECVSLTDRPDAGDIAALLRFPYRLAEDRGMRIFLIMEEFQNILFPDEGEELLAAMRNVMKEEAEGARLFSYILTGSMVNAMKEIFEVRRFFGRMVERVKLMPVDEREITDHAIKGFLSNGKVTDKELILGACSLFKNNLWYINHFIAVCDSLSMGYIMSPVLLEALDAVISVHKPRFVAIMNDLTTFQVNLLRAITDRRTLLSGSETVRLYGLNSSANVKRVKEALMKKEIITFNEKNEPEIIDPLFEYWVRKYYFEKKD